MAVSDDHIFHLASGTELSVEAARGDLARVRGFFCEDMNGENDEQHEGFISDMDHVVELIQLLADFAHVPSNECTSDDPNNHQGDTCPVHEGDDMIIGRVRAAKWDVILAAKTGLSQERREVYLMNVNNQLATVLEMLGDTR